MKKQEFKRMKRNFWTSLTTWNILISELKGCQKKKEQQEFENLFEQIMKENFPNLEKEIDFQEVQEVQSPKEAGPKEAHTTAHHNYISQH